MVKSILRRLPALLLVVLVIFLFVSPALAAPINICIDPGHGQSDSGAIGPAGSMEKDINLAVAIKTAKILKTYPDLNIYLTRASDHVSWSQDSSAQDLQGRCDLANGTPADIFISLHCDSFTDPAAKGTTAYCYQFGGQGEQLARAVHTEMLKIQGVSDGGILSAHTLLNTVYGSNYANLLLPDHGLKEGNFQVLRNTDMPAALIEMSFISNPAEEIMLNTPEFQQKAAQAIALGVLDYLGVEPVKTYDMGKPTMNINGTAYVPLNMFLKTLGAGAVVKWDQAKQAITITQDSKTYELQIGSSEITEVE